MDMLAKVADTGMDVVAITHIDAVKQMVDQQVEVVATGDGTSRLK
jgi:DNA repair exonuclease SbcCD ATPase subunit